MNPILSSQSVYLKDFESRTHSQREEILQKYQQELQELMENAIIYHSNSNSKSSQVTFGISVLDSLGSVFTQFLAWQRLMQMIENIESGNDGSKKGKAFDERDAHVSQKRSFEQQQGETLLRHTPSVPAKKFKKSDLNLAESTTNSSSTSLPTPVSITPHPMKSQPPVPVQSKFSLNENEKSQAFNNNFSQFPQRGPSTSATHPSNASGMMYNSLHQNSYPNATGYVPSIYPTGHEPGRVLSASNISNRVRPISQITNSLGNSAWHVNSMHPHSAPNMTSANLLNNPSWGWMSQPGAPTGPSTTGASTGGAKSGHGVSSLAGVGGGIVPPVGHSSNVNHNQMVASSQAQGHANASLRGASPWAHGGNTQQNYTNISHPETKKKQSDRASSSSLLLQQQQQMQLQSAMQPPHPTSRPNTSGGAHVSGTAMSLSHQYPATANTTASAGVSGASTGAGMPDHGSEILKPQPYSFKPILVPLEKLPKQGDGLDSNAHVPGHHPHHAPHHALHSQGDDHGQSILREKIAIHQMQQEREQQALLQQQQQQQHVPPSHADSHALGGGGAHGQTSREPPQDHAHHPTGHLDDLHLAASLRSGAVAAYLRGKDRFEKEIDIKLSTPFTYFYIGRKNPKIDLDLFFHTEVKTISHQHCGIIFNELEGHFEIKNFGRNGTRVNGLVLKIEPGLSSAPLHNNDVIEIGKIALKFTLVDNAGGHAPTGPNASAGPSGAPPSANAPPPTGNLSVHSANGATNSHATTSSTAGSAGSFPSSTANQDFAIPPPTAHPPSLLPGHSPDQQHASLGTSHATDGAPNPAQLQSTVPHSAPPQQQQQSSPAPNANAGYGLSNPGGNPKASPATGKSNSLANRVANSNAASTQQKQQQMHHTFAQQLAGTNPNLPSPKLEPGATAQSSALPQLNPSYAKYNPFPPQRQQQQQQASNSATYDQQAFHHKGQQQQQPVLNAPYQQQQKYQMNAQGSQQHHHVSHSQQQQQAHHRFNQAPAPHLSHQPPTQQGPQRTGGNAAHVQQQAPHSLPQSLLNALPQSLSHPQPLLAPTGGNAPSQQATSNPPSQQIQMQQFMRDQQQQQQMPRGK